MVKKSKAAFILNCFFRHNEWAVTNPFFNADYLPQALADEKHVHFKRLQQKIGTLYAHISSCTSDMFSDEKQNIDLIDIIVLNDFDLYPWYDNGEGV